MRPEVTAQGMLGPLASSKLTTTPAATNPNMAADIPMGKNLLTERMRTATSRTMFQSGGETTMGTDGRLSCSRFRSCIPIDALNLSALAYRKARNAASGANANWTVWKFVICKPITDKDDAPVPLTTRNPMIVATNSRLSASARRVTSRMFEMRASATCQELGSSPRPVPPSIDNQSSADGMLNDPRCRGGPEKAT